MTKQFTFYQFAGNGCAVYFYQRTFGAVAFVMDPPGHQFFTRPVFAGDQHAGIGWRHFINGIFYAHDAFRFANHFLHPAYLFAQHPRFLRQLVSIHGIADGNQHAVEIGWFADIVKRAFFNRIHGCFNVAMPAHHYDGHIGIDGGRLVQKLKAIHPRHLNIAQHYIKYFFLKTSFNPSSPSAASLIL